MEQATSVEDRMRVRIRGAVQGVGFRPFVHGLASRWDLSGFVLNDADGVLAEVEGFGIDPFMTALVRDRPPLARIDNIEVTPLALQGGTGFTIRLSVPAGRGTARAIPDVATCGPCLQEVFDPKSRFHLYPFVTCTHCGPRFTITHRLPYDRANTSMAPFELCERCSKDYRDPGGRRFHAETIACPSCGPRLSHSFAEVVDALSRGLIIAMKGIGGFHFMCDATNEGAVQRLRRRKRRPDKPFAVMVANSASALLFGHPTFDEVTLLNRPTRPIVLVLGCSAIARSIAPGLNHVGLMLPSAPVHHLLFHALAGCPIGDAWLDEAVSFALVATSANACGEPLAIDDAEALALDGIADMVVTHDRRILARADDSVMSLIDLAPSYIRRSRGIVPEPIDLGEEGPTVLAVGAHLKATICVTRGREAFVSQHLGDLVEARTITAYAETVRRMLSTLNVVPERVVCDLHPDYRSTMVAEGMGFPILRVQHHAAHLAAVAAEHQLRGPMLGVALDGHGLGTDGNAWGGEAMLVDGDTWIRCGHLLELALPGGERAAREPWRMGVAALVALKREAEAEVRFPGAPLAGRLAYMLAADGRGSTTTSMGRLFDAVASLLGVCTHQSYEGQAAIQLEALVDTPACLADGYALEGGVLDFRPLLARLLEPGLDAGEGASLFHGTLIAGLAEWIGTIASRRGHVDVVLGGGCFVNRVLADGLTACLRAQGLRPHLPRMVPANDGGISLGQAALGRASLMAEHARSSLARI